MTLAKKKISVKMQLLATATSIVGAVALPQILHLLGIVSGLGSSLGEAFLPMHLPIILVGLLAGPYAGAVSGFIAPLLSFALSGMPSAVLLPFMILELSMYGLLAGLLNNNKMPVFGKLFITQIAGRAVRAVAILIAFYAFESTALPVSIIWTSVLKGTPGIVLQWCLVPLFMFWVNNRSKNEE